MTKTKQAKGQTMAKSATKILKDSGHSKRASDGVWRTAANMDICHICNNPTDSPKSRIVGGKIVEQCVAKCHDQHVCPTTNAGHVLAAAKKSFRKSGTKRA